MNRVPSFTFSKAGRLRRPPPEPLPRPFDCGLTTRRPLVPLPTVMLYLNLDQRDVLGLIEEGRLRWAFDIRSDGSANREVRVFRQSVLEYARICQSEAPARESEDEEFRRVTDQIVPAGTLLRPGESPARRPGWPISKPKRILRANCPAEPLARPWLPQQPVLWGTEIAQCFSCGTGHVANLIREKSLPLAKFRRSPKASPVVERGTVVLFLRKRRIP